MSRKVDLLFLCCAYSDTNKELFRKKSRRGYQFAAQNLQEALIQGFLQNDINIKILSIPSLSSYPRGCSLFKVDDNKFCYNGRSLGWSVGYVNLPFIKSWNKKRVISYLNKWYYDSGERKVIFVYALLSEQMQAAVEFKKNHPDVKLCVIVPDLPRFMGYNSTLKKLGFQKRDICNIYSLVDSFDAFVVLAKPMVDDLQVSHKKHVVVEGIFSESEDVSAQKEKHKTILYTGNIGERYGINVLMEAFTKINDPDYRLWIRGNGDNSSVLEKSQKDNRIKYIGPLSKRELISLQKKATILVNPVSPDKEFTRFFFPSKTMDYMASGTPTVMFKLECLPEEYYQYLYFFDKPTPESMAYTIKKICEKSEEERDTFGIKASRFIKAEKNAHKQVEKIKNLMEGLFD